MKRLAHVATLLFSRRGRRACRPRHLYQHAEAARGDDALHADTAVCDPDARGWGRALRERLAASEAERDEIEAAIAEIVPPAVEFHPTRQTPAATRYRT